KVVHRRRGIDVNNLPYAGAIEIFFFFQAEDGIRDLIVTGVQTCALPILACRLEHRGVRAAGKSGPAGSSAMLETASQVVNRSTADRKSGVEGKGVEEGGGGGVQREGREGRRLVCGRRYEARDI